MRVQRYSVLVAADFIAALVAVIFYQSVNITVAMVMSIVTLAIVVYSIITIYDRRLSLSSALLLYIVATQFGLALPYLLLGRDSMPEYSDYVLRFMQSDQLIRSLLMGNLAVATFEFARRLAAPKRKRRHV